MCRHLNQRSFSPHIFGPFKNRTLNFFFGRNRGECRGAGRHWVKSGTDLAAAQFHDSVQVLRNKYSFIVNSKSNFQDTSFKLSFLFYFKGSILSDLNVFLIFWYTSSTSYVDFQFEEHDCNFHVNSWKFPARQIPAEISKKWDIVGS